MATRGILTEMSNERSRTPLIDPVTSRINVINNALESLEFTPQSPDEMVIQQRGRRNIPVIYTSNPCTASQVIFYNFVNYLHSTLQYCHMIDLILYL